jgi:LysM repeat protein
VAVGDTLWDIAQEHGCTVDDLRATNRLPEGATLRVGMQLKVPAAVAHKRDVEHSTEPSSAPSFGHPQASFFHTVISGDTLAAIAQRYRTTVARLRRLNGLDGNLIRVGQRLAVDGSATTVRVVPGQSRGKPYRGKLHSGVQLPAHPAYYRRRPHWAYAAQHVVDYTRSIIVSIHGKFADLHRLAIGDLSAPDGGRIPGHRSHQSGRDVDVGLYFRRPPVGYPDEFVVASAGELHVAATWALVWELWQAAKQPGGPERIFLDYGVQKILYEHAARDGVPKQVLQQMFQYPQGRWARDRFISHEAAHADHLHVRFRCPPDDRACE